MITFFVKGYIGAINASSMISFMSFLPVVVAASTSVMPKHSSPASVDVIYLSISWHSSQCPQLCPSTGLRHRISLHINRAIDVLPVPRVPYSIIVFGILFLSLNLFTIRFLTLFPMYSSNVLGLYFLTHAISAIYVPPINTSIIYNHHLSRNIYMLN